MNKVYCHSSLIPASFFAHSMSGGGGGGGGGGESGQLYMELKPCRLAPYRGLPALHPQAWRTRFSLSTYGHKKAI